MNMGNAAPSMSSDDRVVEPERVVSRTDSLPGHKLAWHRFHNDVWTTKFAAGKTEEPKVFTLVTFNVWFATHRLVSRAEELIRTILLEDADFVCLQEVTVRFLTVLLADKNIRERYCVSSTSSGFEVLANEVGYDAYMLCKVGLTHDTHLYRYKLTSKFARSVFVCFGPSFSVATVHLESCEGNQGTRAIQMGQIYNILSDHGVQSRTFLCGDMNHCPSLGEQHFPASTIDVWPLLHPNDPGWTENSTVNLMLASKPGKHPLVRFDRIVVTGNESGRVPKEIRILGTHAIAKLTSAKETVDLTLCEQVWTSDHFGLVARFEKQ